MAEVAVSIKKQVSEIRRKMLNEAQTAFSSRRRHTILTCDWSSDVCSSDLFLHAELLQRIRETHDIAPHTVIFGGFSADSLSGRMVDMKCEVLITQDRKSVV